MTKSIVIRHVLAWCLILLFCFAAGQNAFAADPVVRDDCSIELELEGMVGGTIALYKVAGVSKDGDHYQYDLSAGQFDEDTSAARELITLPGIDAEKNRTLSAILIKEADDNHIELLKTADITDEKVSFTGLGVGMYLLRQTVLSEGDKGITPFLMSIPDADGNYNITAKPKSGITTSTPTPSDSPSPSPSTSPSPTPSSSPSPSPSPTPTPTPTHKPPRHTNPPIWWPTVPSRSIVYLPQTGQLWWPVAVMGALALLSALVGILLRCRPKGKKGRGAGTVLCVIALVLLGSALGLTLHNMRESNRAGEASREVLQQMEAARLALRLPDPTTPPEEGGMEETAARTVPDMPTEEIGGYRYIGSLTIPTLELVLPVMEEWDYDRLKISPCRYAGNYFSDDLVICGHNFPSHFSPIKDIDMGAEVVFTTVDGVVYRYLVSNRETVDPEQVDYMIDQSAKAEEWDLTLFTCTTGGQTRCAVRCLRADKLS